MDKTWNNSKKEDLAKSTTYKKEHDEYLRVQSEPLPSGPSSTMKDKIAAFHARQERTGNTEWSNISRMFDKEREDIRTIVMNQKITANDLLPDKTDPTSLKTYTAASKLFNSIKLKPNPGNV